MKEYSSTISYSVLHDTQNAIIEISNALNLASNVSIGNNNTLIVKGGVIKGTSVITLNNCLILPNYNVFLDCLSGSISVIGFPAAGTFYFQNGIPTWSNGSAWVDATGATV